MKENEITSMKKAIVLFSGGLDSLLAYLIMNKQVHCELLHFDHGFRSSTNYNKITEFATKFLNAKLHIMDVSKEYVNVLLNPKDGYGKYMNPCVDCHAFFLRKAWEFCKDNDFDFLVSGEVLGQRPKSQIKCQLTKVTNMSGCGDYIVRPLSAKLLTPSLPEREGWVDRTKLYNIEGRSRKRQNKILSEFGYTLLNNLTIPQGGCLLIDDSVSVRLKLINELVGYEPRFNFMLRVGRLFNVNGTLLLVGKNKRENEIIASEFKNISDKFLYIEPLAKFGEINKAPICLVEINKCVEDLITAVEIAVSYADKIDMGVLKVLGDNGYGLTLLSEVEQKNKSEFEKYLIK